MSEVASTDRVEIQIQDITGNWRTVHNTENVPQQIAIEMRSVQSRYPDRRVRAITLVGQLLDMI